MAKSSLYTGTGDDGTTSLVGGSRRPKQCARIEAYGTVDELNSWIGLVAASLDHGDPLAAHLQQLQCTLFDVGAYIACPHDSDILPTGLTDADVTDLENAIDTLDGALPKLRTFTLPGGTVPAAQAQIARAVCRRAERRILTLNEAEPVEPIVLLWLNRLSDYLYALGRTLAVRTGRAEPLWQPRHKK